MMRVPHRLRWLAIGLPLLLAGCARAPAPGVVELVYATPYGPTHPFSRADRRWMDFVEQRSQGRLKIRPSWSGALLSSEHSMVELRHGVADIGLITPIYVKGGAHLIRVQSGFYSGAETVESQVALYHCMADADPQFAKETEGLKVLAVQGGSMPGLLTRHRPVTRLADLQGLRIRVPTELISVMRKLGADPVNMPMGEVYSALAKGVIDGVIAPPDTFRALHFAEVARLYTTLKVPRGAYPARAMSAARWAQLAPEDRAVLEAGIPVWEAALADTTRSAVEAGLKTAQQDKVEFLSVSPEEQQAFLDLYAHEAETNARALARYGIDGEAVLQRARAAFAADGSIQCQGNRT